MVAPNDVNKYNQNVVIANPIIGRFFELNYKVNSCAYKSANTFRKGESQLLVSAMKGDYGFVWRSLTLGHD